MTDDLCLRHLDVRLAGVRVEHGVHQGIELLLWRVPRLEQVVVDVDDVDGGDGRIRVRVGGQQGPSSAWKHIHRRLEELDAAHLGHAVVGEQDGHPASPQLDVPQCFECLGSRACADDPVVLAVLPPEVPGDGARDRRVVVHGQQVGASTGRFRRGVALGGFAAHCLHSAIFGIGTPERIADLSPCRRACDGAWVLVGPMERGCCDGSDMNALDIARWQFGITTVHHFLFVPLTIGLAPLVALMQTAWYRTGDPGWYRLTRFFGKLFLINFALGVVTGIVQEFQFGMNWSDYSRFVGDVFGAPLAIEGLLAFFLESTFLGLWIFGWDRLPPKLHLACIWMVAIGVNLSAFFILAANSFMQHPVGYAVNTVAGRAELHSIGAVLTNSTTLGAFAHTITAALLSAGMFVLGISAWHLAR